MTNKQTECSETTSFWQSPEGLELEKEWKKYLQQEKERKIITEKTIEEINKKLMEL